MTGLGSWRRDVARLWSAYAASEAGSAVGAGALPLVALLVLRVSDWQVSLLAAVGGLTSAVLALPLGPFIEARRKRPVMIAADLGRAVALVSVPLAAWTGRLSFAQLCVVAVASTTGAIAFAAASGAHLKHLVPETERARANSRFETTLWTATSVGPPLGGLLISWLGATSTMLVDAISFVASAVGIRSLRSPEPAPPRLDSGHHWSRDIATGWSYVFAHPGLRALFINAMTFGGSLMAASPLQSVLMLRDLGFTPWQYGLALGLEAAVGSVRCTGQITLRAGCHTSCMSTNAPGAPARRRWLGWATVVIWLAVAMNFALPSWRRGGLPGVVATALVAVVLGMSALKIWGGDDPRAARVVSALGFVAATLGFSLYLQVFGH